MTFRIKDGILINGNFFVDSARNITARSININSKIESNSTDTGAIQVDGGVGISGNLTVGGEITATTFYGNVEGGSTNLSEGAPGSIPYQLTTGSTTFLSIGQTGYILTSDGTAPTWTDPTGLFNTATMINSQIQTDNSVYYPLIVDSNNSSPTAEFLYTTSSFYINPSNGNLSIEGTVTVGPATSATSISAIIFNNTLLSSFTSNDISSTSAQDLDTFPTSEYRSARYFSQITMGSSVHISEISIFHDGTTAYLNEYGIASNNGVLGVFNASLGGGTVTMSFTPNTSTTMVIKMTRIALTV